MDLLSLVVIVIGVKLMRERGRGAGAEALAPKTTIERSDWLPLAFCKVDNIFNEACGGANTAPRSVHGCQYQGGWVCVYVEEHYVKNEYYFIPLLM